MADTLNQSARSVPWNAHRIIGSKPPLKPKHIWAIRQRLTDARRTRDLALFNCAIDSKLRGCDLVALRGKLESTVTYLGIEVDDALELSEQTEI
jgi:hypothetical protein